MEKFYLLAKILINKTRSKILGVTTVGECSNFKIFLRTRKIMVMHSNERGECCLRTNADRLWKQSHNVEEVVVRLPDPTDPSTVTPAPPSS